jgi:hypothetical protein
MFLAGVIGSLPILAGCGTNASTSQHAPTAPSDLLPFGGVAAGTAVTYPKYVSADLKDAYQFALERPDVLRALPCYCGCGLTIDHKSNLDCFVAGQDKSGAIHFDDHASYCQTCLDIARDAKRLIAEGKRLPEIREYVDRAHGQKGPATDTPKPAAHAAGTGPIG